MTLSADHAQPSMPEAMTGEEQFLYPLPDLLQRIGIPQDVLGHKYAYETLERPACDMGDVLRPYVVNEQSGETPMQAFLKDLKSGSVDEQMIKKIDVSLFASFFNGVFDDNASLLLLYSLPSGNASEKWNIPMPLGDIHDRIKTENPEVVRDVFRQLITRKIKLRADEAMGHLDGRKEATGIHSGDWSHNPAVRLGFIPPLLDEQKGLVGKLIFLESRKET